MGQGILVSRARSRVGPFFFTSACNSEQHRVWEVTLVTIANSVNGGDTTVEDVEAFVCITRKVGDSAEKKTFWPPGVSVWTGHFPFSHFCPPLALLQVHPKSQSTLWKVLSSRQGAVMQCGFCGG